MGIFIAVIITTIVVAAICAAVYVFVFRSKHKQEVMANSQVAPNIPTLGMDQAQGQAVPGQPMYGNMADASQPPAPTQMMNDITSTPQSMETPVPPAPPAQEDSYIVPAVNPTVDNGPVDTMVQPEMPPTAQSPESPTLENPLDLSQMGDTGGNLLDDTPTAPISEMAAQENTISQAPGDMADFSVSATQEEVPVPTAPLNDTSDALERAQAQLGEQAVSTQTEERVEKEEASESAGSFQPPMAPQTPPMQEQAPEVPVIPSPDAVPAPDSSQTGPKDMNI